MLLKSTDEDDMLDLLKAGYDSGGDYEAIDAVSDVHAVYLPDKLPDETGHMGFTTTFVSSVGLVLIRVVIPDGADYLEWYWDPDHADIPSALPGVYGYRAVWCGEDDTVNKIGGVVGVVKPGVAFRFADRPAGVADDLQLGRVSAADTDAVRCEGDWNENRRAQQRLVAERQRDLRDFLDSPKPGSDSRRSEEL